MPWLSRVNFVSSDTLSFTDVNNLGNDIRAWGDNVNGGGYTLSNVVLSASSGTMATLTGGTGTASTLTIRSTSGAGTTDAIIFQTGSQVEAARITTAGRFAVGTSSPARKLTVYEATAGTADVALRVEHVSSKPAYVELITSQRAAAFGLGAFSGSGFTGSMQLVCDGGFHVCPSGTGNLAVGLTNPAYQLQLSTDSAAKPSTNTWTIASDERLKTVLGDYEKGLDAICALRPVRYEYNGLGGMPADGKEHISIVAQEAQDVFPECIGTFVGKLHEDDEEETELLNYNGHAVTFALINAVRELKARLDALA